MGDSAVVVLDIVKRCGNVLTMPGAAGKCKELVSSIVHALSGG